MMKDHLERRAYRKSPGRQYGYDYNPLRQSSNVNTQSGRLDTSSSKEQWPTTDENLSRTTQRTSGQLAPRPDPRRTRQLMRQSILASKSRSAVLDDPGLQHAEHSSSEEDSYTDGDQLDSTLFSNRHIAKLPAPAKRRYTDLDAEELEERWPEQGMDDIDPDLGYEDVPFEEPAGYAGNVPERLPMPRNASRRVSGGYLPTATERGSVMRPVHPLPYEEDEDDYYEDDQGQQPVQRREKKKGLTRRKLLFGAVAVGGTAFAAYELAPKIPQALQSAGTNIEHQIQDAFNRGFNSGAEAVRKEFINSLDNLEGVSLDAAMGAARLTRVAYDVFVSPLLKLAATITGDFLTVTLRALITARGWLKYLGQDTSTMAALQTVLESWVNDVTNLPQKLQSITDSDLDGAQTYLRGVQRKIKEEQAKLNGQTTPTPRPTSTPKH